MARYPLRIIPLGGLGEIGKNALVVEFGEDLVLIDLGLMFPEEEMLGIDLVIPDITYLLDKRERLRGILITHGHEDHIGALPFLYPQLGCPPIYATKLSAGLIRVKLKEGKALEGAEVKVIQPGERLSLGAFKAEAFRVNHSIPDAVGYALETPAGIIIHTGDFKFDHTPVDGCATDFARLARWSSQGVLALLSDSTHVELPGYTPSERVVGEELEQIIARAPGRVILATFASQISRIQQVLEASAKHGRKVCILGRSMLDNAHMALELGYLTAPPAGFVFPPDLHKLPPEQITVLVTGSQGEPTSVLARLANRDHRQLKIIPGDTVIVSASPIPGNEELVNRTIDNLFKQGARVYYSKVAPVHVHGHASQEELKLMIGLVKPRYFVPIHGEARHLALHAELAKSVGLAQENIFVLENGQVLELGPRGGRLAERVPAGNVYVDGLVVSDISNVVLRDRRALAQDGVVVVIIAVDKQTGKVAGRPDVVSRGFVDQREAEELLEESRRLVIQALDHGKAHLMERGFVNAKVKDVLSKFYYQRTRRRPMILPVAMEV